MESICFYSLKSIVFYIKKYPFLLLYPKIQKKGGRLRLPVMRKRALVRFLSGPKFCKKCPSDVEIFRFFLIFKIVGLGVFGNLLTH